MRLAFPRPRVLACLALVLSAALPASAAAATPSEVEAAQADAVQWIEQQQEPSGQIPGFGGDWAASALAAAGVDVAGVRVSPGDPSLQDHLLDEYTSGEWIEPPGTGPFPMSVTDYERATLASYAAGLDPARLSAASNMPAQIAALWSPTTGSFGAPSSNGTAFAILALARTPLPNWALQPAVTYLRRNQHDDGGWEFGPATTPVARATPSTAEMTGAALAALCEAGVPAYDAQVAEGIEFLQKALADNAADDGGFEYPYGGPNGDTNAWAVSGLTACGLDPQSAEWTTPAPASKTPVDYLLSLQETDPGPDKGSFEYFGFPGLYTTQDALRAISGEVFSATPLSLRTPPSVAAGTPVPHTLALDLGTRGVRVCKVTAAAGASLIALLDAAKTTASPAGCVDSVEVTAGRVTAIDGVSPANADEAWLLRLDRGPQTIAGAQPVAFGDVVSLRLGAAPASGQAAALAGVVTGPAGKEGKPGERGKRGRRGRPGRNASIGCRVRHRGGKHRLRCAVKHHNRR